MFTKRLLSLIIMFTVLTVITSAQHGGGHGHGGHINPDSIETVTVTGFAIVDSTSMIHNMYYLDENNDGEAEYFLNFGPYWYEPDSSNAERPEDGDKITIEGGLVEDMPMMDEPMVIVYEINGEFWRNPFDAFWNHMGSNHMGGEHGECNGYGFGWMHDSLETVTVNGTAVVDTTFMHKMYYLDENNDQIPDYFLNFGPPWYEPESGATRPENGDDITITGGLLDSTGMNNSMIIVYEINGLLWRDTSNFGHHMGSGWIHEEMTDPEQFHSPFDPQDIMVVNPGWHNGGMMMPDSLFCQFLELFPEDLPQVENEDAFAGYEIAIFYPDGMGGMGHGNECGGHMQFNSDFEFTMHYNDVQVEGFNVDESTIQVKTWNSDMEVWELVSGINVNTNNNTVAFSSQEVDKFIILSADQTTDVNDDEVVVEDYSLKQNYPNPFNPATNIEFTLPENSNVKLTVYNVIGQKIKTLINNDMSAGIHTYSFDAGNLPSGTYFYELTSDNVNIVKKMILLK